MTFRWITYFIPMRKVKAFRARFDTVDMKFMGIWIPVSKCHNPFEAHRIANDLNSCLN